ncbi:hypothetical protein GcM1_242004 [Golovinomyces cichoracearum]|uniref:La protein-like protein n=1 Tax=Golovinomyces cichoracearum TaxID=62708 RepID=A0A420IGU1_9PEZI|nr:hypothetical protein GcM1_242004 [Golovinomyces cichoracearum]
MSTPPIGDTDSKRTISPVQNEKINPKSNHEAGKSAIKIESDSEKPISSEKTSVTEPVLKTEKIAESSTSKQEVGEFNNSHESKSTEPFIKSEASSETPIGSVEPYSTEPIIKQETIIKKEPTTEDLSQIPSEDSKFNTDTKKPFDERENKENDHKVLNGENSSESAGNSKSKNSKPTYPDGVLKTRARVRAGVSNSKYDPTVLPITDDPIKIRAQKLTLHQVEFYFGDANLPTDKYMRSLTEGSSNKPVPIKKICEFGRMRRFRPYSAIVSALRESQFLKVSGEEGEELVERRIPYEPNTHRDKYLSRSIYAKGFGDEEPSSQFDIEAFFAPYGPTNAVRLRRTPEKLFKGSVFVEFVDEQTANKFLNLTSKPLWKGEYALKIMSKNEYIDLKAEEIRSGNVEPQEKWINGRGRGRGRGNFRGNRGSKGNQNGRNDGQTGDRDPDNWKKRREDDRASGFKNGRNHNHGKRGREKGRGRGENRFHNNKNQSSDKNTETEKNEGDVKPEPNDDKSNEPTNTIKNDDKKPTCEGERNSKANLTDEIKQQNENSKKRLREDDEELKKGPNKKLDTKNDVSV